MRILLTVLFIAFVSTIVIGQNNLDKFCEDSISNTILSYIQKFNEKEKFPYYGTFNGIGYIGPVGSDFYEFRDTATIDELIYIINHKNPIVKAYSFWALIHKEGVDLMPIIKEYVQDTTHLAGYYRFNQYSDLDYLLCDFFIEKATLYNPKISMEERRGFDLIFDDFEVAFSGLSVNQYRELDSLLIFTPNRLAHSKLVFLSIEPDAKYYEQLKIKYQTENINQALIAIAKFHKKEDIELISE